MTAEAENGQFDAQEPLEVVAAEQATHFEAVGQERLALLEVAVVVVVVAVLELEREPAG